MFVSRVSITKNVKELQTIFSKGLKIFYGIEFA